MLVRRLFASAASAASAGAQFDLARPIVNTKVHWVGGANFEGTDNDGRTVKISGGSGDGVSPMNMLLLALGSCASVDLVSVLKKQRTELERLDIAVQGQRGTRAPKPYEKAHMTFTVAGKGVTKEQVEYALALSMEKYCGVHGTLHNAVDITWEADVEDTAAALPKEAVSA